MNNNNKNPTSQDVAKLAGVSQSAVSRCFTKNASISSRTKLRVIEAAKKLRYKPQTFSRLSSSENESGLVGVILPYVTNRYYPEVLTELHEALRISGYRILLITTDDGEELDDRLIQHYLKDKLIAIISATKPTETFVTSCTERRIQVIAYNRNWNIPTTSSVACDHRMGGEMIAKLFIEKDHQHIGLIKGPTGSYVSQQRCKGFLDQLKKTSNVKVDSEDGFFTYEGGQKAAEKLLQNKKISAIFCADDTMAFGCLDFVKRKTKLKIPHNIEIVGFDDISVANWKAYNLTTIRQPIRQMAKLTTQLIGDYLEDVEFEPVNHLIQGRLINRKTTR